MDFLVVDVMANKHENVDTRVNAQSPTRLYDATIDRKTGFFAP